VLILDYWKTQENREITIFIQVFSFDLPIFAIFSRIKKTTKNYEQVTVIVSITESNVRKKTQNHFYNTHFW